jgi:hypothetical protein
MNMAFTPAQIKQPFAASQRGEITIQDLIHVRQLYLERRYKQCISRCQELIVLDVSNRQFTSNLIANGLQLHGIHKSFLHFHEAISYEALGQAAHAYSRNKLHFLELAKEKFTDTLDCLPQPFNSSSRGVEATPRPSPIFVGSPAENEVCPAESPESVITPTIEVFSHARTVSDESKYSTSNSSVSETYTVPDFNKYSPRPDLLVAPRNFPRTVTFPDVSKMDETDDSEGSDDESQQDNIDAPPSPEQVRHDARLSACLSSTHVLAKDLVPSPLFSRTKKIVQIPLPPGVGQPNANTDTIILEAMGQAPRPLPPTPFIHADHTTLLPSRRTAVQTLITKYEDRLPSPNTPSSYTTASVPPFSAFTPRAQVIPYKTPTTARLANIAAIFAVNKADRLAEEVNDSLSSHALARYNSCLADFRTCLRTSITRIEEMIDQAQEAQEHRLQEKRDRQNAVAATPEPKGMGQTRLRSFWLLKDTLPSPVQEVPDLESKQEVGSDIDSPYFGRGRTHTRFGRRQYPPGYEMRHIPMAAQMMERQLDRERTEAHTENRRRSAAPIKISDFATEYALGQASDDGREPEQPPMRIRDRLKNLRVEEDGERRQQRIAKLRAAGFEVRKEDRGWKGGRHYDDLARRVERTLG